MKLSKWVVMGLFGLFFQAAAVGQIYESEDADGVPDFSDTPTAGAEVVDLPKTNLMDAPPVGEAPQSLEASAAPAPRKPAVLNSEQGDSGVVYYGGDDEDNPRAQRHLDEDHVDNALPGAHPGVEPRPAEGETPGAGEARAIHHEGAVHRRGGGRR